MSPHQIILKIEDFYERQTSRMKRIERNLTDSPVRGSNNPLTPARQNQHTHKDMWQTKLDKTMFQTGHSIF